MNEWIHTAAETAGLYCDGTPDSFDSESVERFAEMIVRECISVMNITAKEADEHNTYMGEDVPTSTHQYVLKKHFGVE